MEFTWKDKVVLITGAASGIGAHVVRALLNEDVKHVAVLDVASEPGIALQNELNQKYGKNIVKFYQCDACNDDQVFAAYKSVLSEAGYIDVVINNAGIMNDSPSMYKKEIELNFTAVVTGTLKAIELMRKDEGGRGGTVVNVASDTSLHQSHHMPIYFATKSAVMQFSNCIGQAENYERTGVRVLTICFGATTTPLITPEKLFSFDKKIDEYMINDFKKYPRQSPEAAARGLLEAYKRGKSGSTWLITRERPAEDITPNINKGYQIMSENAVIFN